MPPGLNAGQVYLDVLVEKLGIPLDDVAHLKVEALIDIVAEKLEEDPAKFRNKVYKKVHDELKLRLDETYQSTLDSLDEAIAK